MHVNLDSQSSGARAWVRAAQAISTEGEGYNVIIGIDDPVTFDALDNEVIVHVDKFLRAYDRAPIATIVNTIFPQVLYRRLGSPAFYTEYLNSYDKLARKGWGRYFERMTRRVDSDGQEYNPLADLIEKLKKQNDVPGPYKATYELALYDPDSDRNLYRNAPCLSFLTFKRHPDKRLSLTALYRNHAYIARCLGNLIGLGQLQAFVAKEANLTVGSLTCISTHAEIDNGQAKEKTKQWGIIRAKQLIKEAAEILDRTGIASAPA